MHTCVKEQGWPCPIRVLEQVKAAQLQLAAFIDGLDLLLFERLGHELYSCRLAYPSRSAMAW